MRAQPLSHGPTLCNPKDCRSPGSSVHGISQARILDWDAISFSRRSLWPKDQTCIFCIFGIGGWILYHWATRESPFVEWKYFLSESQRLGWLQVGSRLHTHNFIQSQVRWLRKIVKLGISIWKKESHRKHAACWTLLQWKHQIWGLCLGIDLLKYFRTRCPVCPCEDKLQNLWAQRSKTTLSSLILTYGLTQMSDIWLWYLVSWSEWKESVIFNIYSCLPWPPH